MGTVHWIETDGTVREETAHKMPDWELMQKYVEGYIELVRVLHNGAAHYLIVNEEGRMRAMPFNEKATEIYFAASRSRGVEPTDPASAKKDAEDWARSKGIRPDFVVSIDPRPDLPPGIYGPAILLENIKVD